jgi:hypothetical protein
MRKTFATLAAITLAIGLVLTGAPAQADDDKGPRLELAAIPQCYHEGQVIGSENQPCLDAVNCDHADETCNRFCEDAFVECYFTDYDPGVVRWLRVLYFAIDHYTKVIQQQADEIERLKRHDHRHKRMIRHLRSEVRVQETELARIR